MMTIMGATQHGFGLLLLDTGTAERKSEFLTTAHRQDGVEQTNMGKNVHGGRPKYDPRDWSTGCVMICG